MSDETPDVAAEPSRTGGPPVEEVKDVESIYDPEREAVAGPKIDRSQPIMKWAEEDGTIPYRICSHGSGFGRCENCEPQAEYLIRLLCDPEWALRYEQRALMAEVGKLVGITLTEAINIRKAELEEEVRLREAAVAERIAEYQDEIDERLAEIEKQKEAALAAIREDYEERKAAAEGADVAPDTTLGFYGDGHLGERSRAEPRRKRSLIYRMLKWIASWFRRWRP